MRQSKRGMTLVEVVVCAALLGAIGAIAAGVQEKANEKARAAKCQSNLKRQITAIFEYVSDYDGVLPGPVDPAIKRHTFDIEGSAADADRRKSLTWLLRPYFPAVGDSTTNPATENPIVDEVFRCPTASMIVPDSEAYSLAPSCTEARPFSYVCNTWGPVAPQGTFFANSATNWNSTDPPNYFGAWNYCDTSPVRADTCWKPKRLDAIANAAGEWATADAWYRRIQPLPSRSGSTRQFIGTYAQRADGAYPEIPSAPYHGVPAYSARSTLRWRETTLPVIEFDGETNMAYFDGHVSAFKGDWIIPGFGGPANPYWQIHGGTHPTAEPWDPAGCNDAAP